MSAGPEEDPGPPCSACGRTTGECGDACHCPECGEHVDDGCACADDEDDPRATPWDWDLDLQRKERLENRG